MSDMDMSNVRKGRELDSISVSLRQLVPLFEDSEVSDIFMEEDGRVFYKQFGLPYKRSDIYMTEATRWQIVNQISNWVKLPINDALYPALEAEIPSLGYRLSATVPPWSISPCITIRKPSTNIFSLDHYVSSGRLSEKQHAIIQNAIACRANIIIAGGMNSGKTTFLNGLLDATQIAFPSHFFVIIQDTPEIQCRANFKRFLRIKRSQSVEAVQVLMRSSADRIIFGEVRDGHVLWDLLDAWNTGQRGGYCTIHSDTAASAFSRMEMLLRQKFAGELPDLKQFVHYVVHLSKHPILGVIVDSVWDCMADTFEENIS